MQERRTLLNIIPTEELPSSAINATEVNGTVTGNVLYLPAGSVDYYKTTHKKLELPESSSTSSSYGILVGDTYYWNNADYDGNVFISVINKAVCLRLHDTYRNGGASDAYILRTSPVTIYAQDYWDPAIYDPESSTVAYGQTTDEGGNRIIGYVKIKFVENGKASYYEPKLLDPTPCTFTVNLYNFGGNNNSSYSYAPIPIYVDTE